MVLIYEFTYISKNGVLENFLDDISKNFGIDYYINSLEDKVFLHVKDENEDRLLEFSNTLSAFLPISIFIVDTKVYVSEEFDRNLHAIKECETKLPFTPKSLNLALKEFNPFIKNEIGKNPNISSPLVFTCKDKKEEFYEGFKEAFLLLADEIIKNGANLKTTSGTFFISLINQENHDLIKKEHFIMPTDLGIVDKAFIIKKEEIAALASLEKPILTLPTNLIFSSKNAFLPKLTKISLANDLFLQLLSKVLFEKGVEFVFVSKEQDGFATLSFSENVALYEPFEVVSLKDSKNLIVTGLNYTSKEKKEKIKELNDKSYTYFVSLLEENSLFNKNCCGFFLSEKHSDKVMFYSEKSGMLDFVTLKYEKSISKIFEIISLADDSGAKLIQNYKENFQDLYSRVKDASLKDDSAQNFHNLFSIIALLLGFGENLEDAQKNLIQNFTLYTGSKGPRFDYKLNDEESLKTTFNAYKLIRSALSYKLAGVDDSILAYGLIESLVFFLSDTSDDYKERFDVKNVAFFGSFFRHKVFTNLCVKHISPNYKINFNKELPIEF